MTTSGYTAKDLALEALEKKYGKPTMIADKKLQNRYGAQYNSYYAEWTTPELHIDFTPTQSTLDSGIAHIETLRIREIRLDYIKKDDEANKKREL